MIALRPAALNVRFFRGRVPDEAAPACFLAAAHLFRCAAAILARAAVDILRLAAADSLPSVGARVKHVAKLGNLSVESRP